MHTTGKSPIILLGGNGFVGSAIAAQLARQQVPVLLPTRHSHQSPLRVLANVDLLALDIHRDDDLDTLLGLADDAIVINLVGILHDREGTPYGPGFAKAHVELPSRLIAAMHRHGLSRLIHMSALGADAKGPSMYQRSKGDGENLVRNSGLDWTIFRPSVIFGRDDHFINLFAAMQKTLPLVPLAGAGVLFQPVSVQDVALAFINSLSIQNTIHQSYDLAGPTVFTLAELVRFAGKLNGHPRRIIALPDQIAWLQAWIMEHLPGPTLLSRDNLRSMQTSNILADDQPNALTSIFGIIPGPLIPEIYR